VGGRVGGLQIECSVWPRGVVVLDVDAEDVLELAAAEDEEPVETFAADGADSALHVRVCVRCADGGADGLDVFALEKRIECSRERGVSVVGQEPHLSVAVVEAHQ
jgi:hypothetical protein